MTYDNNEQQAPEGAFFHHHLLHYLVLANYLVAMTNAKTSSVIAYKKTYTVIPVTSFQVVNKKKEGSSPTFVVGLDLFLWSRCLQFCGFAGYILWLT